MYDLCFSNVTCQFCRNAIRVGTILSFSFCGLRECSWTSPHRTIVCNAVCQSYSNTITEWLETWADMIKCCSPLTPCIRTLPYFALCHTLRFVLVNGMGNPLTYYATETQCRDPGNNLLSFEYRSGAFGPERIDVVKWTKSIRWDEQRRSDDKQTPWYVTDAILVSITLNKVQRTSRSICIPNN